MLTFLPVNRLRKSSTRRHPLYIASGKKREDEII